MPLPTQAEIFAHALEALDQARNSLSDARDWLNSDWRPEGSALSDAGAQARRLGRIHIGKLKNEIDDIKQLMQAAIDDPR